MHLSRLTTAEMVELSQSFCAPGQPAAEALSSRPELATLMSRLREVHQVLSNAQSSDDLRANSLQKEVAALDAEHDALARGIDHLFQGLVLLSDSEELGARWTRLHRLLMPSGASQIAGLSLEATGDNASLLQQIVEGLPAQDKSLLKSYHVGKRSLFDLIGRWTSVGTEIGNKERERQSVPVTPSDGVLQDARSTWTRTVGAMASMLSLSELLGELPATLQEHVLVRLRAATAPRARPVEAEAAPEPAEPAEPAET